MKKIIFISGLFFLFFTQAYAGNDNWKIAKSTHFIIHYKNATEDFVKQASDKAEEDYDKIASELGFNRFNFWLWDNRAKIYIYDSPEDYQSATGEAAWSAGTAVVKSKVITVFVSKPDFFNTILSHEMGHIIFREFVGFDNYALPLWLDEGVASYQEKAKYAAANLYIRKHMEEGDFMDLRQLSRFSGRASGDDETVKLFYAEAFSIVDFLVKRFGSDSFVSFCQSLRDKKDLEQAIASAYPFKSLQALDEEWQKYLNE